MKKSIIQQEEYFYQQIELECKEETSTLLHTEYIFVWCWRRMGKIGWRIRVNEVLHRVKKDRNILNIIKRRNTNRIGHILKSYCLLNNVNEGRKTEWEDEKEDVSSY